MKREARILVSSCRRGWCAGVVVRGDGIDGVAISRSCTGLCMRLAEEGFLYELRYAVGDCTCGLPEPPRLTPGVKAYSVLSDLLPRELAGLPSRDP